MHKHQDYLIANQTIWLVLSKKKGGLAQLEQASTSFSPPKRRVNTLPPYSMGRGGKREGGRIGRSRKGEENEGDRGEREKEKGEESGRQ